MARNGKFYFIVSVPRIMSRGDTREYVREAIETWAQGLGADFPLFGTLYGKRVVGVSHISQKAREPAKAPPPAFDALPSLVYSGDLVAQLYAAYEALGAVAETLPAGTGRVIREAAEEIKRLRGTQ